MPLSTLDPIARCREYLHSLQRLAPDPSIIHLFPPIDHSQSGIDRHLQTYALIGQQIEQTNAQLQTLLQDCHACFHPAERRSMQIFAAPFTADCEVDGVCNLHTQPVTLLIDVGRVVREDWLNLVVHEYVHAHLGYPGHSTLFAAVLTHLCLGLGLQPPTAALQHETLLRYFPPYTITANPSSFWQGNH